MVSMDAARFISHLRVRWANIALWPAARDEELGENTVRPGTRPEIPGNASGPDEFTWDGTAESAEVAEKTIVRTTEINEGKSAEEPILCALCVLCGSK
jgi:hypothetical protein